MIEMTKILVHHGQMFIDKTCSKLATLADEEHREAFKMNSATISLRPPSNLWVANNAGEFGYFELANPAYGYKIHVVLVFGNGNAHFRILGPGTFDREMFAAFDAAPVMNTDQEFAILRDQIRSEDKSSIVLQLGSHEELELVTNKAALFLYKLVHYFDLIIDDSELVEIANAII
jgi:hypothetical protein